MSAWTDRLEQDFGPEKINVKKYEKLPVQIEAVKLGWDTWNDVCEFVSDDYFVRGVYVRPDDVTKHSDEPFGTGCGMIGLLIKTLEGEMLAIEGDYIIKGIQGEFYPCKPDIFEKSYREVEEETGPVPQQHISSQFGEGIRIGG